MSEIEFCKAFNEAQSVLEEYDKNRQRALELMKKILIMLRDAKYKTKEYKLAKLYYECSDREFTSYYLEYVDSKLAVVKYYRTIFDEDYTKTVYYNAVEYTLTLLNDEYHDNVECAIERIVREICENLKKISSEFRERNAKLVKLIEALEKALKEAEAEK